MVTKRWKVHSISHITGGGIVGNTMRVVPKGLKVNIDWSTWEPAPIFRLIQETGKISAGEMRKVFNMGIGLIFIVSRKDVIGISSALKKAGEKHYIIGNITE